ncbi:hypothetical protein [Hyphococcus sp.]|uniref:hypothetical protein n=1 Tax=Hyphococcus sp. TaxID=2038636 RepID=UPI003CCC22AB
MLLRRITEHVKAQNWTAVAIDFVIVVVGVFIGIQVANWNEARRLNQTTQTYYDRLIDDLRAEQKMQAELAGYYDQVKRHGVATLARLEAGELQASETFFIDAYQASQIRYYTAQRATYNELLGAGIASAIPDAELRSLLATYYLTLGNAERLHEETTPYRSNLRIYMPYRLQALIREKCKEKFILQEDGSLVVDLTDECSLNADPALLQKSLLALQDYDAMERELGRHLSNIDIKIISLQIYQKSTESILEALLAEREK